MYQLMNIYMVKFLKHICYISINLAIAMSLGQIESKIWDRTDYVVDNTAPLWSPDSKTILFTAHIYARNSLLPTIFTVFDRDEHGDSELYLAHLDGTATTRLTNDLDRSIGIPLQWSPNGRQIVFSAVANHNPAGLPGDIYTMYPDGSHLTLVPELRESSYPQWSPDGLRFVLHPMPANDLQDGILSPNGKKLIATSKQGLVAINIDGSERVLLSRNREDRFLSWSPDSQKVLYEHYSPGSPSVVSSHSIVNANGSGKLVKIFSTKQTQANPSWSSNGQQILFEQYDEQLRSIVLWTKDTTGSHKLQKLRAGWGGLMSPNGRLIAFICLTDHNPTSLCVMNTDGSNLISLKQTTQSLAWSPDSKKIAFTDLREPHSLAVIAADGSNFRRLTHQKLFQK